MQTFGLVVGAWTEGVDGPMMGGNGGGILPLFPISNSLKKQT